MRFTRIVMVAGSMLCTSLGLVFTACGGFSGSNDTADAQSIVMDGSIADDSATGADGSGAVDASLSDAAIRVPIRFCVDGDDAGHYACLDFEDGGGAPQWQPSTIGGKLVYNESVWVSPTHSASIPLSAYQIKPNERPQHLQRRWKIGAFVKASTSGSVSVLQIKVNSTISPTLLLKSGAMAPACNQSDTSPQCSFPLSADGGFERVELELDAVPVDGGFDMRTTARYGDASVQPTLHKWVPAIEDAVLIFGDPALDGGLLYDNVVVDVEAEEAPSGGTLSGIVVN